MKYLPESQRCSAGEARAQPLGTLGRPAEQPRGRRQAGQREHHRDHEQRRLVGMQMRVDRRQRQLRLEEVRHGDEAAERRERGQQDQHAGHRERRLVHVVLDLGRHARAAEEGEPEQAEHVERGHQRRGRGDEPEQRRAAAGAGEGVPEDLVLGEEAGERRDPGDRRGGDREGPEGERDAARQPAHAAHVLLAAERVDHAAGAEEEAGLEEGVRDEVEDRHAVGADAEREEHEAELRDGRVGEHLLDVGLDDGDRGGEEGRGDADDGDQRRRLRRLQVDRRHARHQVDAGRHHRRRVDQRRDRRRAGHGVGQPDVQRDLRRLAASRR